MSFVKLEDRAIAALTRIQDTESPLVRYRVPIGEDRAEVTAAYKRIEELESTLRYIHTLLFDYDNVAIYIEDVLDPHRVIS